MTPIPDLKLLKKLRFRLSGKDRNSGGDIYVRDYNYSFLGKQNAGWTYITFPLDPGADNATCQIQMYFPPPRWSAVSPDFVGSFANQAALVLLFAKVAKKMYDDLDILFP